MKTTILSKQHLAGLIDECIMDIQNKSGSKLQTLGNLFKILGDSTKNDALAALAVPFASLGATLSWFATSPVMAMLTPDVRQRYEKLLEQTCKESIDSLKRLKTELCVKRAERPKEILNIVAKLDVLWIKLSEEINILRGTQPEPQA